MGYVIHECYPSIGELSTILCKSQDILKKQLSFYFSTWNQFRLGDFKLKAYSVQINNNTSLSVIPLS